MPGAGVDRILVSPRPRLRFSQQWKIACGRFPVRAATIVSDVPARLDRLPWSSWHRMMVIALGITWLLDGLEVMLSSSLVAYSKTPVPSGYPIRSWA
jgi:hypothetical protein